VTGWEGSAAPDTAGFGSHAPSPALEEDRRTAEDYLGSSPRPCCQCFELPLIP
jgi:hypothetical protein